TYKDSPAPLPVTKTAFTSPPSETSLESAAPPDEGGARLRDVLLAHPDLGPVVQRNGIPDAITLNHGENSPPVLAFYYLNPPRTPSCLRRAYGPPNLANPMILRKSHARSDASPSSRDRCLRHGPSRCRRLRTGCPGLPNCRTLPDPTTRRSLQ